MARGEELEIEIDPTGKVLVHVKGVPGQGCMEYVEIFEAFLGPVEQQRRTPEFYDNVQQGGLLRRFLHRGDGSDSRRDP